MAGKSKTSSFLFSQHFCRIIVLVCLTLCLSLTALTYADSLITNSNFNLNFSVGQSFMYQDLAKNVNVTFTVTSGSLVGNASINTNDAGGSLSITPSTAGSLQTTASSSNFYLYFNGVYSISDNYVYNAGTVFSENTFDNKLDLYCSKSNNNTFAFSFSFTFTFKF